MKKLLKFLAAWCDGEQVKYSDFDKDGNFIFQEKYDKVEDAPYETFEYPNSNILDLSKQHICLSQRRLCLQSKQQQLHPLSTLYLSPPAFVPIAFVPPIPPVF